MDLQMDQVSPLLARSLKPAETPRVTGWLAALNVALKARYGQRITGDLEPFFLVKVADAIQRRLDKPKQMVESESAGPFSARWASKSTLGSWFSREDLAEMDEVTGSAGARSYRTPAPDAIRFNNRMELRPEVEELDIIANTTIRGSYVPFD